MKTSEMIAMLEENPKLRFNRKNWDLSCHVYVSTSEIGMIKFFNSASDHVFYTHHDDWQLVREPVPVWEAIKALWEGKNLVCELENEDKFTVRGRKDYCHMISKKALQTGKWFIEDE